MPAALSGTPTTTTGALVRKLQKTVATVERDANGEIVRTVTTFQHPATAGEV